jgi:deoxycytidine triphosphate deaminase
VAVLGRQEILDRILDKASSGGKGGIFVDGTWEEKRLRGAAYDLRVSGTYLIMPDGTRYWPNSQGAKKHPGPFKLHPREVAFVSTVECFSMPHDLAGNIALRFRRALEGILIMGGMLIDPCYEGRLHFQLVNIGEESINIVPGRTSLAAVQFLPIVGATETLERVPDSQDLLDELFYEGVKKPLPQLAFFTNVRQLESDQESLESRLSAVKRDVDDQRIELDSTRRSTDQLLVFGVFLVSITLFAVAIGVIVDALTGESVKDATDVIGGADLTLAGLAVAAGFLFVVGFVCYLMTRPVAEIASRRKAGTVASEKVESGEDRPS